MFVSENRLSRPYHDGLGWVVGASFVNNRARQDREYGYGPLRAVLPGVTNRITEVTGYAEATVEIMPDLIASGGLRLSHARLGGEAERSEEHTSELQSLMRISYAVFCLKKKKKKKITPYKINTTHTHPNKNTK